jgi:hypothetical protein
MLYFQVLFYVGSLLPLSYHYSQLIPDIYGTGLDLNDYYLKNLTIKSRAPVNTGLTEAVPYI